ncbi:MAG TPA: glycosyltransferase family 4 protein [Polyangia bacterium]|jgi:glycosyltransferase involved in cell wall biosynthesis
MAGIAPRPLTIAVANCVFDADVRDPEQLLERYHAMTGWAEAVAAAGAGAVIVVQRFGREAVVQRGPVEYRFVSDGGPAGPPLWFVGVRLGREVVALRPDVVHVHGLIFPAAVAWLRLQLPCQAAIVVQDHGAFRLGPASLAQRVRQVLVGAGLNAADGFMFTAREQAVPWQQAGIIRARHAIYEVPESSTNMASWPAAAEKAGALPGRPAILSVARLDANKDPLTVLEGFARAAATLPEAALTMVYGDDVLLPGVEAWLRAHPALRARIYLRGFLAREVLAGLYRSADIFTIGSHREVACFSLIEALSFGVTPVVTDIPAFRAITGGRVGALFPPGDAGELGRALRAQASGNADARRQAVREHFERELSWPVVGARALAAYRAAAEARRGPRKRSSAAATLH